MQLNNNKQTNKQLKATEDEGDSALGTIPQRIEKKVPKELEIPRRIQET